MTPEGLIPYLMAGHIILVAEFRGGKIEAVGYVDKTSGLAQMRHRRSYAVERQGLGLIEHVTLTRYLMPGDDPDKAEITLEKGELYAFALEARSNRCAATWLVGWLRGSR
jgi:hypothetical protein